MYIAFGQPLLDSGIHDSLLSSHFHHFRGEFWGVDCPFGGSGGVGPFGGSGTGWPFGALGVDWPFGVLGGLRPRDFGIHYSGQATRVKPVGAFCGDALIWPNAAKGEQ